MQLHASLSAVYSITSTQIAQGWYLCGKKALQHRAETRKQAYSFWHLLTKTKKKLSRDKPKVEQYWAPGGGAETPILLKLTHSLEVLLEVLPVHLTGQKGRFGNLALLSEGDGPH